MHATPDSIVTDQNLRKLFETARLPASRFDHEGHVRLAWIYVTSEDLPTAIGSYCRDLQAYAASLGVPDKYHATITWFFMILVGERVEAMPEADWETFKAANEDLITSGKALLSRHYSSDVLRSDTARRRFVLPDRNPTLQSAEK